ncbi:hypothetical protein B0H66DRAFT_275381 [Apodospora peruviana]|uniref:Calcineurin-like phosphoesterase domain-containing protein n=1 Tax=Apodospora peruviana TaxID=516989 RepID=A0AAE0I046_9PEZI|nr:hypothetical protein B0H66DRAFT_275381 [Apodospora peruviana]
MKIQILSDLHLENPKGYDMFEIMPKAPYLALLGDIGNVAAHKHDFLAFLTVQLHQFAAVLFVPGNHEAYHSSWPETIAILREFQDDVRLKRTAPKGPKLSSHVHSPPTLGEFVLLDRNVFVPPGYPDIAILGCSLFSAVPPDRHMDVGLGLNDFFQTSDWTVDSHNGAHARDLAWLNAQVESLQVSKIVILTHWTPTRDARAVEPIHVGSRIQSAFSTDLSTEKCFRSHKVKVWGFGHTHYNCDFMVEREGTWSLRLIANQRGYYFRQTRGFDMQKTVEI